MTFRLLLFFCLILNLRQLSAQPFSVKGKITDKETNEVLAFVNITINGSQNSTASNIDGEFQVQATEPIRQLCFSYVGYEPLIVALSPASNLARLSIKLVRKSFEIKEVMVTPGSNPANRIIQKVIENRDHNNPEKINSFSYKAYNRMHFTMQEDSSLKRKRLLIMPDSLSQDSASKKVSEILKKRHLLLMEFMSQRFFKHPDKSIEEIISSRVSGFTDPSFTLLATQMQSFAFYSDIITLLGKKYLNPISRGSLRKYSFSLENTYLSDKTLDTIFVISFKPRRNSNFESLQGVLYINSDGYAIQNVIAEPTYSDHRFAIRIQQQYELIDRRQWFPTQLNTDLLFKHNKLNSKKENLYLVGIGKSYLFDINLSPDLSNVKFSNVEVKVGNNANKTSDSTWAKFRPLPLNRKDSVTYHIVDSIGRAQDYDKKLETIEALMSGYIPYGIFNINYRSFLSYNGYEGLRLGFGLATNHKVASFFSLGGYFAYGFHDEARKYGTFLQLFPSWKSDTKLNLKYSKDVYETSNYSFFDDHLLKSSEWFRSLLIGDMNWIEDKEAALSFRALKHFKFNLYFNEARKQIPGYAYIPSDGSYTGPVNDFRFAETGLNIKFGFKEKFIETPRGKKMSLGTDYPMLWFNLRQGIDGLGGHFNYTKYELKISKTFTNVRLGQSQITIVTAKATGHAPICNLYNGHGSFLHFTLETANSFGTMRQNEFYSSEFASLFLKQDFGGLFFSSPKLRPEVNIVTNIGVGRMRNQQDHQQISYRTLEKGYFESGLVLNKLLNTTFTGCGVGVFYRYGPYALRKTSDNFAYKLTLYFNL
ncbi:MAG: DUF5686 family protein [Bacteroidota bacterium]|nr:DUF5686 family protein [Bacteroidota bacterium]